MCLYFITNRGGHILHVDWPFVSCVCGMLIYVLPLARFSLSAVSIFHLDTEMRFYHVDLNHASAVCIANS